MLNTLRRFPSFFLPYSAFVLISGIFLIGYSREQTHLWINQYYHPIADSFFMFYTHLGDGMTVVALVIVLLFVSFRSAIFLAISGMVSGGTTQLLKNYVFGDVLRPSFHFQYYSEESIRLVPDLDMHIHNSFPSGHTTAAFCIFTALMLIINRPKLSWLFFVLAFLVGFSRVYLSQHFLVDIYFGSIIGILFTLILYEVFYANRKLEKVTWLNKSLIKR